MFRKRSKKEIPPEAFIAKPARIMAILQLCAAFSLALWYLSQPYMGDHFSVMSSMKLYEYAMKHTDDFAGLPIEDQQVIRSNYHQLQAQSQIPFSTKLF